MDSSESCARAAIHLEARILHALEDTPAAAAAAAAANEHQEQKQSCVIPMPDGADRADVDVPRSIWTLLLLYRFFRTCIIISLYTYFAEPAVPLLVPYRVLSASSRSREREPNEVRELWASLPRGTGERRALRGMRETDLLSGTTPHAGAHPHHLRRVPLLEGAPLLFESARCESLGEPAYTAEAWKL